MITYKCLHGLAPSYLPDVCILVLSVVGRGQLRSADSGTHVVTRTRTTIGRRDFAVSGPATWNSLPVELPTLTLSIETFVKKRLKNHLFGCYNASEDCCLIGAIKPCSIKSGPLCFFAKYEYLIYNFCKYGQILKKIVL